MLGMETHGPISCVPKPPLVHKFVDMQLVCRSSYFGNYFISLSRTFISRGQRFVSIYISLTHEHNSSKGKDEHKNAWKRSHLGGFRHGSGEPPESSFHRPYS